MPEESKNVTYDEIPAKAYLARDGECYHVTVKSQEMSNELVQEKVLQSITFDTEQDARYFYEGLGQA